jgi:hypothetical protein
VGEGERDCLMADHANDFDLKLAFDAASGADIRAVKAATAKPDGGFPADAPAKGPWFVTKLPAGNDKVRATGRDEMTAAVPATGLETAVSNQWPGAEAAEETPGPRL